MFRIDGNRGAVAAICEMLVQSHDGIELLPALPPKWPTGSGSGLRLRGGFEIDIDWRDGRLKRAELRSQPGGACKHHHTRERTTRMKPYWQGVFPAVTTQMHPNGTVDLDATARHLGAGDPIRRGDAERPGLPASVGRRKRASARQG